MPPTTQLREAAERAQATDLIERHPEGLEGSSASAGRSLSGGERQRISIARALLKDPPILILDEATSALDATTERKVQAALDEVMKGRTTFVIAHRLATVRNAARILVFDQGRIIECGSFDELVARKAAASPSSRARSFWPSRRRRRARSSRPRNRAGHSVPGVLGAQIPNACATGQMNSGAPCATMRPTWKYCVRISATPASAGIASRSSRA